MSRLTLFYSNHCPACRDCKPKWDAVMRKQPAHLYRSVDVDHPPPDCVAACKQVTRVPQLAFTDARGTILRMVDKSCSPEHLTELLESLTKSKRVTTVVRAPRKHPRRT